MSPDQGDGGCTPHFLFGCAEKETGRARSKGKGALAQNGTLCLICLCAGAPVLLKFSAVLPRRTAIVRRRVQDRFDLRFPSAAALPTSQRFILIFYPGSAKRSGERGKRRAVHSTTTPKAVPTPPNAGKHPLCSPRLKRTPVPASRFPPHRHQRPPSLSKPDRQGGIWTQKRFSFGPGAARFLWQDQRKWGAHSPCRKAAHLRLSGKSPAN